MMCLKGAPQGLEHIEITDTSTLSHPYWQTCSH